MEDNPFSGPRQEREERTYRLLEQLKFPISASITPQP